jgi:hypothetical protein
VPAGSDNAGSKKILRPSVMRASVVTTDDEVSATGGDAASGGRDAEVTLVTVFAEAFAPELDLEPTQPSRTWLAARLRPRTRPAARTTVLTARSPRMSPRETSQATRVKAGYTGTVSYDHASIIKSAEAILGLPTLSKASSANALSDLFKSGQYP